MVPLVDPPSLARFARIASRRPNGRCAAPAPVGAATKSPPLGSAHGAHALGGQGRRGGPWDWSRDLREQDGFDEHAAIIDGWVEDGFVLLGGPLEGDREVLHVVDAPSVGAIHARLGEDNWTQNGMLETVSVERWTILLDGLRR